MSIDCVVVAVGIHPQVVANAFSQAVNKAESILTDMAIPIDLDDRDSLLKNAVTSLNSKVSHTGGASYLVDRSYDDSTDAGGFSELSLACSNCRRRGAKSNRPSDCDQRGLAGYTGEHGYCCFFTWAVAYAQWPQESPAFWLLFSGFETIGAKSVCTTRVLLLIHSNRVRSSKKWEAPSTIPSSLKAWFSHKRPAERREDRQGSSMRKSRCCSFASRRLKLT